jgi:Raf kinase inhibitor-like YbhB/YbcL family protein
MGSMRLGWLGFGLFLVPGLACAKNKKTAEADPKLPSFAVTSTAYTQGGDIPTPYTCEDKNVSPPVAWTGLPAATKSVALVMDDPDAPAGTWVHWVVYDLPASGGLPEAAALPGGARDGRNDFGNTGYGGPCPPSGKHRYYLKVYALDSVLPDLATPTKAQLEKAMAGHILARGELMGKYQKHKQ